MKKMKKVFAVLLAVIMVMGISLTAFAADSYSITVKNDAEGHTYEAYQIFSGTVAQKDGKTVLANIQWGKNVSAEGQAALGNAAEKAATLATQADAEAFAKEVAPYLTKPAAGTADTVTAEGTYVIDGLEAGYYLVKDADGSLAGNEAYTSYILKVVGDVVAEPKSDIPSSEKKVDDKNDSNDKEDGENWQDSADYDIGDEVPFKLTGTLPNNFEDYETYKLIFHDKESAGLTFDPASVVVKIDGVVITTGFTVVTEGLADGCTFEVRFDNVRDTAAHNGSVITVEYKSTLNENAVIGAAGNPNEMHIEYSNNPNDEQGGETGNTPDDKVIVFTYKVVVNKTNEKGEPLTGAEFTLEKKVDGEWVVVDRVTVNEDGTIFSFEGLDDGDYRLTETKTPDGYNTIDPIEFTITAEHEIVSDDPRLVSINGDAATGEITFTPDVDNGAISTDIVNKSGSELPETGGIGTTIFYIVGSVLVVGAAILLITKKRMGAAK